MYRFVTLGMMGLAMAWTAGSLGCSEDTGPSTESVEDMPPATADASEIEKALANLPAEDKELVMLMKDCPVSGEPLGSMGEPIKVTKDGRDLFICCEHCRKQAEDKFADFIAKVDAMKAAAPAPAN